MYLLNIHTKIFHYTVVYDSTWKYSRIYFCQFTFYCFANWSPKVNAYLYTQSLRNSVAIMIHNSLYLETINNALSISLEMCQILPGSLCWNDSGFWTLVCRGRNYRQWLSNNCCKTSDQGPSNLMFPFCQWRSSGTSHHKSITLFNIL